MRELALLFAAGLAGPRAGALAAGLAACLTGAFGAVRAVVLAAGRAEGLPAGFCGVRDAGLAAGFDGDFAAGRPEVEVLLFGVLERELELLPERRSAMRPASIRDAAPMAAGARRSRLALPVSSQ